MEHRGIPHFSRLFLHVTSGDELGIVVDTN
jgi:hypothetical protein